MWGMTVGLTDARKRSMENWRLLAEAEAVATTVGVGAVAVSTVEVDEALECALAPGARSRSSLFPFDTTRTLSTDAELDGSAALSLSCDSMRQSFVVVVEILQLEVVAAAVDVLVDDGGEFVRGGKSEAIFVSSGSDN